jgi:RNA polymerase sigma-70 factor, ECF subfamily
MWNVQETTAAERTDRELVASARSGDQTALEELIQRHYQTCVKLATAILGDRFEAQDEVQNTCWKVFQRLDQYQGEAEFLTWMRRIVTNQCLMVLRVRRRRQFSYIDGEWSQEDGRPMELPSAGADPEQQVLDRETTEVLQREMRRIPSQLRAILLLRHVEELTMQDIAARLEISVPAAKSRLHRARLELRSRMVQCYGAGDSRPFPRSVPVKPAAQVNWLH